MAAAGRLRTVRNHCPQGAMTIATLTRRLKLRDYRIQHLKNWLRTFLDSDHADFTYEIGFLDALRTRLQSFELSC